MTSLQKLDLRTINASELFAMHSVYALTSPICCDPAELEETEQLLLDQGVEIRGFYDVSGFRADADLMVWFVADDPKKLQAAYAALRRSALGEHLESVWSVVSTHRPHEFNRGHVPSCFANIEPKEWMTVYPFVRSYDWYYLDGEKRGKMLHEHGKSGREYPEVYGSTMSAFALGDYEWILTFESDKLTQLTDAMRHQRAVEARLYVREETPFFTGQRVSLAEWISRQPTHG